jgi:predicted CXXCH cytochrome family protein
MANVVRDPRQHPDAILADFASNPIEKIDPADVAFVYGSLWKQRYFTKVGDDYFPLSVQWDVKHRTWKKYFVEKGTDWWVDFYPPDNKQRPTGPLCDGCHSVGYDVTTKRVVEWNVGCERCHGPGGEHVADPVSVGMVDPASLGAVDGTDTCIQCHSQGRPKTNPIQGRYYDWPVGYQVGKKLEDYWELEAHRLGETTFTHFADGTAHKNRMQGNDFVRSLMYTRGVTCFDCHDPHGTNNPAQLRKPASELCLDCHGPGSRNGPFTRTLEEHTHHARGSAGSQCIACHMPPIETTLGDVKVRAHTFSVVMPSTTDTLGVPNSCNTCHTDKTTQWATDAMSKWAERSPWRVRP